MVFLDKESRMKRIGGNKKSEKIRSLEKQKTSKTE